MYNTPVDEYYFWKHLIEEKQEAYETVPAQMFELMHRAEKKILIYLKEKYDLNASTAEHGKLLH